MVSQLPDDMNRAFLPYLTTEDLHNLSLTSKDSHELVDGYGRVKALKTANKILESLKKEETQLNKGILAALSGIYSRINNKIIRDSHRGESHIKMRDAYKLLGVATCLIAYSTIFGKKSVDERYSRLDKVENKIADWTVIKNKLSKSN